MSPDWLLYDFPHVWHLNGFLQSSPVPAFSWTFWMCRRRLNFCGNVFWQKGHIRWAFLWKSLIWLWKKTTKVFKSRKVSARSTINSNLTVFAFLAFEPNLSNASAVDFLAEQHWVVAIYKVSPPELFDLCSFCRSDGMRSCSRGRCGIARRGPKRRIFGGRVCCTRNTRRSDGCEQLQNGPKKESLKGKMVNCGFEKYR